MSFPVFWVLPPVPLLSSILPPPLVVVVPSRAEVDVEELWNDLDGTEWNDDAPPPPPPDRF